MGLWAVNVLMKNGREVLRVFDEVEEADLFEAAAKDRGFWATSWKL